MASTSRSTNELRAVGARLPSIPGLRGGRRKAREKAEKAEVQA